MPPLIAYLAIAAAIGAAAAAAGIVFLDGAAAARQGLRASPWALLLAPAAAGLILAGIARALPGGVFLGLADMALAAQRGGANRLRHDLLSALASFTALAGGAQVGQYGPIAHLGGALARLARRMPPHTAIACGIAGAIAAAFNAPFTALVFAHEVVLRHYSLRSFTPVAISAVVGYSVSTAIFDRPLFLGAAPAMGALHPSSVLLFVAMGGVFGLLAAAYLRGIFLVADRCRAVPLVWRLPAAGLAAGALAFYLPDIASGNLAQNAMAGQSAADAAGAGALAALFAAKVAGVIICLGAGFAGGIVSPTLAAGALAGLLFFHAAAAAAPALMADLPAAALALVGMMALTAPVIGAPLAGILFTMELSGSYSVAIAAAVAIVVAVQTAAKTGRGSYYDMQLARRGIDIRLRPEEWHLRTDTIAPLMRPALCEMPPDAPLQNAIAAAAAANSHVIHAADADGEYRGSISLAAALRLAQADGAQTLAAALAAAAPRPVLFLGDTLAAAMQKTEETGGAIAVVDGGGALAGELAPRALLNKYHALSRAARQEETAV